MVRKGEELIQHRIPQLLLLIAILFSTLILRIGCLQIIHGEYFYRAAEENRIQLHPILAPRGIIFDRAGEVLAKNRPSFNVSIIQGGLSRERLNETLHRVATLLGLDMRGVKEKVEEGKVRPFEPILIAKNISLKKVTSIAERKLELPGVIIQTTPCRYYPKKNFAASAIGYLSEVGKEELEHLKERGYRAGDTIGRSGLELVYERYLKGENGGKHIETDSLGRQLEVLSYKRPTPGCNLILTLDAKVQEIAEEALGEEKGAVVVMNPWNGEILALVSKPAYDPNLFVEHLHKSEYEKLFTHPAYPLVNRVIQAQYAPGSTFKIVVATAAIEEKVITPSDTFYCGGKYYLGRPFACWREEGHGRLNIREAIVHSCNIFFYQLGLRVGPERIAKYAEAYGIGDFTRIDLPNEKRGLLPSPQWKFKALGERWYSGETVNLSIGQGYISVTPIHLVRVISAVATRGRIYRPFLVKQIVTPEGEVMKEFNPVLDGLIQLSDSTWKLLWDGLEGVVERGTGWRARVPGIRIAGKTGTAQNPHGEDHGWFVCFVPVDAPRVAICVFVEHGGHGGVAAAPIAKAIIEGMMK